MRYLFLVSLLCSVLILPAAIHLRRPTVNDNLSSNMVTTIYQDADGLVYFGTSSGLNRYDGYGITTFVNHVGDSTSLHDNFVQDIQPLKDGRLLVRAGDTYSIFDPATEKFCTDTGRFYSEIGLRKYPSAITVDGRNLWLYVYDDGIYRYSSEGKLSRMTGIDAFIKGHDVTDLIALPERNEVYAVTNRGDLLLLNTSTMSLKRAVRVPVAEDSDLVHTLFADRDGIVWAFSEPGLFAYNPVADKWVDNFGGVRWPMELPKAITQDSKGRIWVGYNHTGLVVFDKSGNMEIVRNIENDPRSLPANTVTSLLEDKTGSMWIGTLKKGVSLYNETMYKFDFHKFPDVNCIARASDGNIWIGTDNDGIFLTDRNFNILKTYRNKPVPDAVVCMTQASDGTLYAGTYSGGLLRIRNGVLSEITTRQGLASDNVWSVLEMADGRLMIATLGAGIQILDPGTMTFTDYNPSNSGLSSKFVEGLAEDGKGNVYIATANGLSVYDAASGKISPMSGTRDGSEKLLNRNLTQVFVDSRGLVWIATRNGLNIYDPDHDRLYSPQLNDDTDRKFILGMAEDANHTMWISAGGTLSDITVEGSAADGTLSFASRSYNSSDGLQDCDFNQRSFCLLPDGEMLVGGFYGINSFKPEKILFNTHAPEVKLTGLKLFNNEVHPGESIDGKVILPQAINNLDKITLNHRLNEFTISFATDDYVLPEKTVFSYKLDGFNDEWTRLPAGVRSVTYTNLSPGKYTLRVKATNNDGVESEQEKTIRIVVTPPFYASIWAMIVYCMLAIGGIWMVVYLLNRKEKRKYRRRVEMEDQRKQEELNQLKFKFFTNISHELRTPLTLITAPLDSMIRKEEDENKRKRLTTMQVNANRLLNLVNQLLDFRKNEMTGLTFNPSQGNVVAFIRQICDSFLMLSENKDIRFTLSVSGDAIEMVFDEDKLGKIIMNLLSNAFKYTPAGGVVEVGVSAEEGNLLIKVSDNGKGISDEDKKHIFDRFFQASNAINSIAGSGIGLSLVAEYVKLHDGTVSVADNAGGGTVFSVRIPIRKTVAEPVEKIEATQAEKTDGPAAETRTDLSGRPRILVVDDNTDLLEFISDELSDSFIVRTAENGKVALEKVGIFSPDLIISDIMMPLMSGIELCRILKSDSATAHIPLMMLTAKHDVGAKIEGLTLGADDYLTKPFNMDVLKLRIGKLLSLKEKGMKRALIEPEPEPIEITSLDEQLVEKAVKYVETNIDRPDLTVEEMSAGLGMSRVHLYKKLKQLTGKTPIEFIRVIRLKRAAQLLRESQLNVSEIAYRCGFNNPKYFSKYFKEEFGVLPSVYQENEGK